MVNTFAGNPELVKAFNERFDEAMPYIAEPQTARQVRCAIESVLAQMDDVSNLDMLCAVVIPQAEMCLYKTTARIIREVDSYDYIGVGDSSLLRYLGSLLTETIDPRGFGSEHAYRVGCYLVLKAKAYIEGCGGDTDAYIVRPHGHVDIRSGSTHNTEQEFLWLEHTFRLAVAACFDPRVPERNLDDLLEKMVSHLKENYRNMNTWPGTDQDI